jgi:hypothetical protein
LCNCLSSLSHLPPPFDVSDWTGSLFSLPPRRDTWIVRKNNRRDGNRSVRYVGRPIESKKERKLIRNPSFFLPSTR